MSAATEFRSNRLTKISLTLDSIPENLHMNLPTYFQAFSRLFGTLLFIDIRSSCALYCSGSLPRAYGSISICGPSDKTSEPYAPDTVRVGIGECAIGATQDRRAGCHS